MGRTLIGVLVVGGFFVISQLYLLLKARGFIRDMFPEKWKKPAQIALVVFFIWMATPIVYIGFFGSVWRELTAWELYGFGYPFFIWITASIGLIFLYLAKDLLVFFGKRAKSLFAWYLRQLPSYNAEKHAAKEPVINEGRRTFLKIASASIAVPPIGISSYGLIFGSRNYILKEVELSFPQLPENLRGLKIAQLCDIHCSQYVTTDKIDKAVKMINDVNADLVVLPGDFVPRDEDYIHPCVDSIKNIKSRYGVFASLGNHDHWSNPEFITKVLTENGIQVLRNAGMTLDIRDDKLNMLGVDDDWVAEADLNRALSMVPEGNFNLLLSHQPPFWDESSTKGVDLTLSGHTHGGQFALQWIKGKVALGEFFHKYNEGLFEKNNSQLYVSTGFGFTGPPIRFNVPPEVVVFTLV